MNLTDRIDIELAMFYRRGTDAEYIIISVDNLNKLISEMEQLSGLNFPKSANMRYRGILVLECTNLNNEKIIIL